MRKAVKKGVRSFEDDRVKAREDKRLKRMANEALDTIVQQIPSANFVCQICMWQSLQIKDRPLQPLQNPFTAALTSSKSMTSPPPYTFHSEMNEYVAKYFKVN